MQNAVTRSVPVVTGILALGCLALSFVPESLNHWLGFDRQAVLTGEVWRMWSGHWLHFSTHHAMMDIAALCLVGAIAERELGSRFMMTGILLGAPLISLGVLLLVPEMHHYRGLSALSSFFAAAAGVALWRATPKLRYFLGLLGVIWLLKSMADFFGVGFNISELPANVSVAWQTHVMGMLLGWMFTAIDQKSIMAFVAKYAKNHVAHQGEVA